MKGKGNGHQSPSETERTERTAPSNEGMIKRVRQPLFERELLTGGGNILDSFTRAVLTDEQALVNACLYIGHMERVGADDPAWQRRIRIALYKINGTMAIDGRARDEAVQGHVGVFFPRHASDKDKKRLEKMQYKHHDDDDEEGNRYDNHQR